jgi:hypothetical protein
LPSNSKSMRLSIENPLCKRKDRKCKIYIEDHMHVWHFDYNNYIFTDIIEFSTFSTRYCTYFVWLTTSTIFNADLWLHDVQHHMEFFSVKYLKKSVNIKCTYKYVSANQFNNDILCKFIFLHSTILYNFLYIDHCITLYHTVHFATYRSLYHTLPYCTLCYI